MHTVWTLVDLTELFLPRVLLRILAVGGIWISKTMLIGLLQPIQLKVCGYSRRSIVWASLRQTWYYLDFVRTKTQSIIFLKNTPVFYYQIKIRKYAKSMHTFGTPAKSTESPPSIGALRFSGFLCLDWDSCGGRLPPSSMKRSSALTPGKSPPDFTSMDGL